MSQERFLNKICFFSFLCCLSQLQAHGCLSFSVCTFTCIHIYTHTQACACTHIYSTELFICIQSELFQFCRGEHKGCVRIYGPCHPWQWLLSYSENLQNLFGFQTYPQYMKRWVLDLAIFSAFDRGSVVESGDEHAQRDCFKHLCFAFHVCSTIQFLLSSKVI